MSKLIIIGGGNSIKAFPNLWIDLKGAEVMAINHAYRFLVEPPKYQISMDRKFWKLNYVEMERLANLGCAMLNRNNEYEITKDFQPDKFFCGQRRLSGIFALSYATIRLTEYDEFFLFGFDFGPINGKTHFYTDIDHAGIDKISAYLDINGQVLPAINDFDRFKNYKISIVGESNIESFPKISYAEFLERLK
jgi:hypothetical protein